MNNLPRYYYRNREGYYEYPLYNYPFVWFLSCIIICLICRILSTKFFLNLGYFEDTFGILGLGLGVYLSIQLIVGIKENHGIFKYLSSLIIAEDRKSTRLNS